MRKIVLELADTTTDAECGDCPLACCESHCDAFGELPSEERRHPECLAAERAFSRLLDVSPEDAALHDAWLSHPFDEDEPVEMRNAVHRIATAISSHAKKAEVKP